MKFKTIILNVDFGSAKFFIYDEESDNILKWSSQYVGRQDHGSDLMLAFATCMKLKLVRQEIIIQTQKLNNEK